MFQQLLGQNHFWHVLQTCLDQGKMIFRTARFFRVKFLLGTCAPSMHVFLCSANLAATLYLLGQDDYSVFLLDALLDLFGFMLSNNLVKLRTLSNQMTFAAG